MTIFQLVRLAGAPNSTKSEFRDASGNIIAAALERGVAMVQHPRIPAGQYRLEFRDQPSKFDTAFRAMLGSAYRGVIVICDVPGRTAIEIHTANSWEQLEGCVAPGLSVVLEPDGDFAIPGGRSGPAFKAVYLALSAAMVAGPTALAVTDENQPGLIA